MDSHSMTSAAVLLTAAEMSRADKLAAVNGVITFDLMSAAGLAIADAATVMAPRDRILIVAGRGNNGGDGLVAASELAARGRDVAVMLFCKADSLKGDAARAAQLWTGRLAPFDPGHIGNPALVIDALFGAGLNRVIKGDPLRMIRAINANGAPVLSVDLPSGINADYGAVMGDAVRATQTITFFRRKPGHLLLPGRVHCGRVTVAQIGIGAEVLDTISPRTFVNAPSLWAGAFPIPRIDGHKYLRGHALVVSGGAEHTGAARLAARAGLRAGAGLVTLASPDDAFPINAAALTSVMVRRMDSPKALQVLLEDPRINALVIGPGTGVGRPTQRMVGVAAAADRGLVLDADALTSFAENPDELFEVLRARTRPAVLTPHMGEFRRIFRDLDKGDKVESARQAASLSASVVVLKGPDTVVALPDGRAAIAENAPPWLATAGAGDVLAGFIAGMLAQGVDPFDAACIGVWLHGEAATAFGPGLIAEDLPEALPGVFRRFMRGLHSEIHVSTA